MDGKRWAAVGAVCAMVFVVVLPGSSSAGDEGDAPPVDALELGIGELYDVERATYVADTFCLTDLTVQSLGTMFDSEPGGIIGADYPRTLALPNGNVLWTFQDARIRLPGGGARYVHNIGMVQDGRCFDILVGGSARQPEAWLFEEFTAPTSRWFWPLAAEMGDDGAVYVFAVDMRERGETYLTRAEPAGTFIARIDPDSWQIQEYGRPADQGDALYGWSIESDDDWTYLFAHCHRQFGWDVVDILVDVSDDSADDRPDGDEDRDGDDDDDGPVGIAAHDRSCTTSVTVGRVPVGRLFDAPEYWDGAGWTGDPDRAEPVVERADSISSPTQFFLKNDRWLAVTKVDDWWGSEIVTEQALHPVGPWIETGRRVQNAKCFALCNTYFTSWIDGQNAGGPNNVLITSLSHNRWDGQPSSVYRPTYDIVFPPPELAAAPAMRCALGHC